jgi:hypothetical protein
MKPLFRKILPAIAGVYLSSTAVAGSSEPEEPLNQSAGGPEWAISWHKIAAGGTLQSHGGSWVMAGTIGQHDDTAAGELQGGPWSLTGGFWAPGFQIDNQGVIFRDRFED